MKNYEKYHKGEISFEELRTKRMKELFTNYSINISKEDAKNKFKDYQKIYEKNWILFDDAEEALKTLKSKYKLVILSNGDGKQQRKNNQIPTKIIKYTKTFVEEFLWQR